jgi:hypothetical protein
MRGKRKPSKEKSKEKYPEACGWSGNDFGSGNENFCWIILQDANFLGALQLLLQEFGLDPVAHAGASAFAVLALFTAAPVVLN